MNDQYMVFDLDGTVVCSKHRYTALDSGGIDLPAWIRDNSRENCKLDGLLPALRTLRNDYKAGCHIVICTARVLSEWDYEFFMENDIPYHTMLSRPLGMTAEDADFKEFHLRMFAYNEGISWAKFCETALFYEDANCVLDRMEKIGIPTVNANEWNNLVRPLAA